VSKEILEQVVATLRANPIEFTAEPAVVRAGFDAMFAESPRPEGVAYENAAVGKIEGLWCRPKGAPAGDALLYLHGGGYVIGNSKAYGGLAGELALAANANVFVPDYRLAPEHPYPAGPDDVLAAYLGLMQLGLSPIAIAGDSAGGGLVMSLLLNLAAKKLQLPRSAVLWSPWLNLACDSPSFKSKAAVDPSLTTPGLQLCTQRYVGAAIPKHAIVNPLTADLRGLPPMLIQVGSVEILLDDATRLATAAGDADVHTRLDIYPGMPHVFQAFGAMLVEGRRALQDSAAFINAYR